MKNRESHREAGAAIGVSGAAYGKWESGDSVPSAKHLAAVAGYLDVSVEVATALVRGEPLPGRRDADVVAMLDRLIVMVGGLSSRQDRLEGRLAKLEEHMGSNTAAQLKSDGELRALRRDLTAMERAMAKSLAKRLGEPEKD